MGATYAMEVSGPEEVRFRSFNDDGTIRRDGRLRLAKDRNGKVSPINWSMTNLFPAPIAIGAQGRDEHPFTSTNTRESGRQGIGLKFDDPSQPERVWFGTNDFRYNRQVTLPKRKVTRTNPAPTKVPRAGIAFGDKVYVCFDQEVRRWTESTLSWSASLGTLPAIPQGDPVIYGGFVYWFCGASGIVRFDGAATFVTYTNATINGAVGGVVYNARLYFVKSTGEVYKTNANDYALATLSQVGGVQAISDTPTGMLVWLDANGKSVPYVIGRQVVYAIDEANSLIVPAGSQLPPSRHTLRATVLGADNFVYEAQGMTVIQWTGDQSFPVGLDMDDGMPAEYRGAIVKLLNGNLSLYALVDASVASNTAYLFGTPSPPMGGGVLRSTIGRSFLASRDGDAWFIRATSGPQESAATMLFMSTAESTYRLWFAWGMEVYTIDLEEGLFNPLDLATGEFETESYGEYPIMDFGYKVASKIALEVNIGVRQIEGTGNKVAVKILFDNGGFILLDTIDGAAGGLNQQYTYRLSADPMVSTEDPPVGKKHDTAQLRLDLTRDTANIFTTPVVEYIDLHVIKSLEDLHGYRLSLDLSGEIDGRSPWQQLQFLHQVMHDSADHLVHFSHFVADGQGDGTEGYPEVLAVKFTGGGGSISGGLMVDAEGRVDVTISEVL